MHTKTLLVILSLLPLSVNSQIFIDFPTNNLVFQRNELNECTFQIQGRILGTYEKIEYHLVEEASKKETNWAPIKLIKLEKDSPFQNFNFVQKAKGGSYTIEIRVKRNNEFEYSSIHNIGIGEVFIIAGQSNAQGQGNRQATTPSSNQVFCISNYDPLMQTPKFDSSLLQSYSAIYPTGQSSWCWGVLGDSLTKRLNVPIFFFNVGIGGTSAADWANSIDSKSTFSFSNEQFPYYHLDNQFPYYFLKHTLHYYSNITGFRAILWHQGEADNQVVYPSQNKENYFENVKKVIETSRKDANNSIPWVISRVSFAYSKTDSNLISNQNQLISELENIFPGPFTDTLINAREDDLHFSNESNRKGLIQLGNLWNSALTDSFFSTSKPILPKSIILKRNCFTNDEIPVGSTNQTIENIHLVQNTANQYSPISYFSTPNPSFSISAFSDSIVCANKSVLLQLDKKTNENLLTENYHFRWNSGQTTDSLRLHFGGIYYLTIKGNYCDSLFKTNTISITDFRDFTPSFTKEGKFDDCEDKNVKIKFTEPKYNYMWNDGFLGKDRMIAQANNFRAIAIHPNGCKSNEVIFEITRRQIPKSVFKIENIENRLLIARDSNSVLPHYEWRNGEVVLPTNSNELHINDSGIFSVRNYYDYPNFNCYSKNVSTIRINIPLSSEIDTQLPIIFPNPVENNGYISVIGLNPQPNIISIYNHLGKYLKDIYVDYDTKTFKIDNVETGLYVFKIRTNRGTFHQKVIVR